jgi:Putative Flp pilus-assembly TadE/G-like
MKFWKDQSGGVSAVFGATLVGMVSVGGAALVYSQASGGRTELQAAVDSAVLAGTALPRSATASERVAAANKTFEGNYGSKPNADLTLLSVNFAAVDRTSSPFDKVEIGVNGRAEARIRNRFAGLLGGPGIPFDANGSARKGISEPICVLALNATAPNALEIYGNAKFTAANCAAMTNSNDSEGMKQYGSAFGKATQFGVTGKASGTGWSPNPIGGVDRITDPFAGLPFPTPGTCVEGVDQKMQQATATLSPGTYCGGLTVKSGSYVKLSPGVYIMKDGPLRVDSNATVEGDEVMIAYFGADSTLYLNGGGKLTITSPRTGTYTNMQMMSDRSLASSKKNEEWFTMLGGSRLSFDGTIYLPEQQVWINGVSHDAIVIGRSPGMIAVADVFWIQGNAVIDFKQENLRSIAFDPPTSRFVYGARLVE